MDKPCLLEKDELFATGLAPKGSNHISLDVIVLLKSGGKMFGQI